MTVRSGGVVVSSRVRTNLPFQCCVCVTNCFNPHLQCNHLEHCVLVYVCVRMCIYVYVCVYMCTYVYVCVRMCMYVYVCVHMCTYVYVCVRMCIYVYVCVCSCVQDVSKCSPCLCCVVCWTLSHMCLLLWAHFSACCVRGGGVLCSCEATDLSWSCSRVSTPSAADPVVVSSSAVFPTTGPPANCVNMLTNVE